MSAMSVRIRRTPEDECTRCAGGERRRIQMATVGKAWNIDDLRKMARTRVPKYFFDYLDGGATSETSMRANEND
ncbi:alpha-hydroxy-acid oxidizing protein, partial [Burkholderia pseudomallei]